MRCYTLQQSMKKFLSAIVLGMLAATSCEQDEELYSVFDVYYPNAFVTTSGAVLSSAAMQDELMFCSDTELSIQGGFDFADDNLVRYGHCWSADNKNPVINKDTNNCVIYSSIKNSGDTFLSRISGLESEKRYYVRSFVITSDGKVGYNPNVTTVATLVPHDKWFDMGTLNISHARADALSVIAVLDGDTITYFGMGRDGSTAYADFYSYHESSGDIEQLSCPSKNGNNVGLWGATGFALNFVSEKKQAINKIYVGGGCTKASNYDRTDYSSDFFVYDIESNTWRSVRAFINGQEQVGKGAFQGAPRTGAVGFTIGEFGFIGLGMLSSINSDYNTITTAYHQDFYRFDMRKDASGILYPDEGYFQQMTDNFTFGPRAGATAVVHDNYAYIMGGFNDEKYFDEIRECYYNQPFLGDKGEKTYTFSWRLKDHFPEGFAPRAYGVGFCIGSNIYYGTGEYYENREPEQANNIPIIFGDMFKYDLSTNTFNSCSDFRNGEPLMDEDGNVLCTGITRATCIYSGDRAYVAGGKYFTKTGTQNYTNSYWVYRP